MSERLPHHEALAFLSRGAKPESGFNPDIARKLLGYGWAERVTHRGAIHLQMTDVGGAALRRILIGGRA